MGIAQIQGSSGAGWRFDWGCYAVMPGERHTVPRAELFAALVVLQNVARSHPLHLVIDSEITVNLINKYLAKPSAPKYMGKNHDLVQAVRVLVVAETVDSQWVSETWSVVAVERSPLPSLLELFLLCRP